MPCPTSAAQVWQNFLAFCLTHSVGSRNDHDSRGGGGVPRRGGDGCGRNEGGHWTTTESRGRGRGCEGWSYSTCCFASSLAIHPDPHALSDSWSLLLRPQAARASPPTFLAPPPLPFSLRLRVCVSHCLPHLQRSCAESEPAAVAGPHLALQGLSRSLALPSGAQSVTLSPAAAGRRPPEPHGARRRDLLHPDFVACLRWTVGTTIRRPVSCC